MILINGVRAPNPSPPAVLPLQYGVPEPSCCTAPPWRIHGLLAGKGDNAYGSMPQQPELTPIPASPAPPPRVSEESPSGPSTPPPAHRHGPQRIPRWLERAELFLRVLLRMYIGLAVCYAPWSHTFWDRNPLFVQFPTLSIYAANGAVRGIISGLGLLNLWIAFQDAVRHRDR